MVLERLGEALTWREMSLRSSAARPGMDEAPEVLAFAGRVVVFFFFPWRLQKRGVSRSN